MAITDDQKAAICRIRPSRANPRDDRRGTGFLVAERLVLTARHVVETMGKECALEFDPAGPKPWQTRSDGIVAYDRDDDWALVRCKEQPPAKPLPLGPLNNSYVIRFETFAFPSSAPDGVPYSGTIPAIGARKIALFTPATLERTASSVVGMSGSPCIVNGVVVAIMVEANAPANEKNTRGGTTYAVPVSVVAEAYRDLPFAKEPPRFTPQVAQYLKAGPLLQEVAKSAGLPQAQVADDLSLRTAIAAHMLRGGVPRARGLLQLLRTLLDWRTAEDILDCAGSVWVYEDTARALAGAVTPPASATVAINATLGATGIRYLHCAGYAATHGHPGWKPYVRLLDPPAGERQLEGLRAGTRAALRNWFRCEDSLIEDELDESRQSGEPVFVVIPPPPPAIAVLAALRAEYPTVSFVVLTGDTLTDEMRAAFHDVVLLEPEIGRGVEEGNFTTYTRERKGLERFFRESDR